MVKIHEKKFVSADPDKCVGCQVCEYMCSWEKEKAFNPLKSRIRVVRLNPLVNISITCRLCEDPPCVAACPRDALTQSEETGTISVDKDKCNGCGWCISACQFGAMNMHPDKKVVFTCNSCTDNETKEPQCVKWCPEEALTYVTAETLAQKYRQKAVKNLFQTAEASKSK